MKKKVLFLLFFLFLTAIVFRDLPKTFYQQDEWHALGYIKALGIRYISVETSPIEVLLLQNRPLARLVNIVLFGGFPLNVLPLTFFTIFLHAFNSLLVFYIIKRFTKHTIVSLAATLFFTYNATAKQATLWFGAVTGVLPSVTFILLSFLSYLIYLEKKRRLHLLLTVIFLFVSLLFKETAMFLFVFFPLLHIAFVYTVKKKVHIAKQDIAFFFVGLLLFLSSFFLVFFLSSSATRYVSSSGGSPVVRLLWSALTYPLEAFSQTVFSGEILFPLSRTITGSVFTYFEPTGYAGIVSELVVLEMLSVLVACALLIPVFLVLLTKKNKWHYFVVFLFFLTNFLPYIVLKKPNAYLESRYYYLSAAGLSFLIGLLGTDILALIRRSKQTFIMRPVFFILVLLYVFFTIKNISYIQDQLDFLKERAMLQRPILLSMTRLHPSLAARQLVYIESDHSFIVPNNPLPFQNGIGYTLLVTYAYAMKTDAFNPFLTNNFFWLLGNQGYKEHNGRGFGFFTDKALLKKTIKEKKLQPESVIAFYYDSVNNVISDITPRIRKEVE